MRSRWGRRGTATKVRSPLPGERERAAAGMIVRRDGTVANRLGEEAGEAHARSRKRACSGCATRGARRGEESRARARMTSSTFSRFGELRFGAAAARADQCHSGGRAPPLMQCRRVRPLLLLGGGPSATGEVDNATGGALEDVQAAGRPRPGRRSERVRAAPHRRGCLATYW